MLTDSQRHSTIQRIAAQLERFDDDTLREMERLTDPQTRELRPIESRGALDRRQLLAGVAVGGAAVVAGLLGYSRVQGAVPLVDEDAARLRRVAELGREMEAVGLDESVAGGLGEVGPELAAASAASARGKTALVGVGPDVEAAVALVDPDLADRARDRLLDEMTELAAAVDRAAGAWAESLEAPLADRLQRRAALRQELAELGL